jgi:glycerol-3-phosphate acyltransferase PlsY
VHPAISLTFAYAIGCISFALIVTRAKGVDIRSFGSGNPGATNVGRLLGPAWGRLVLVLDVAKGAVPVLAMSLAPPLVGADGKPLIAAAAVLGHVYPVTQRFAGGKGVATLIGACLALDPIIALIAVAIHYAVKAITRYVSVASVALAWSFPVGQCIALVAGWQEDRSLDGIAVMSGLAVVITLRHAANFVRIRAGTESRTDDPKQEQEDR